MRGQDELLRKLRALGNLGREIVTEVEATATDVEIDAIRSAPIAIGQKIQKVATNGGLNQRIEVNAGKIGAYVEFGTGQSAAAIVPTLPDEWQDIARRFYINGQGKLIGAPYLYPNWAKHTVGFKDRLKVIMNKAVNR